MPTISWTADQAEDVRQILLDRLDHLADLAGRDDAYTPLLHGLRSILAKLEAAYAND
jgi:hypothetical protein